MLRAINARLEWLLDRDHLIGHAWFVKARTKGDVDRVMRHKIIPLLAEYFYDDWEKVWTVLGGTSAFVGRVRLDPRRLGMKDTGESRYRWTVQREFSKEAYDQIVSGRSASSADGDETE